MIGCTSRAFDRYCLERKSSGESFEEIQNEKNIGKIVETVTVAVTATIGDQ